MLVITPKSEIDEYFESSRLNQSTLVDLIPGLEAFLKKKEKRESGEVSEEVFLLGNAIDTILTGEETDFSEKFYVSNIEEKPSEVEMEIAQYVFEMAGAIDVKDVEELGEYKNLIQEAAENLDWYKGKPGEKRIDNFVKKVSPYFEDIKRAFGKQVISKSQKDIVDRVVDSLRENPSTKPYFDRTSLRRSENVIVYYQPVIYFSYMGIPCKAMLDILVVSKNPDTQVVETVQEFDIKTTSGSTLNFLSAFKRFRYDIQRAWYRLALKSLYPKAEFLSPCLIVESVTNPGNPIIYRVSDSLLEMGEKGREEAWVESLYIRPLKGYKELVEDYKFYTENGWEKDRKIAEKGNILNLTWDKIV